VVLISKFLDNAKVAGSTPAVIIFVFFLLARPISPVLCVLSLLSLLCVPFVHQAPGKAGDGFQLGAVCFVEFKCVIRDFSE
jgi:hypothetical protein